MAAMSLDEDAKWLRFCPKCNSMIKMDGENSVAQCGMCDFKTKLENLVQIRTRTESTPQDWLRRYNVEPLVQNVEGLDVGRQRQKVRDTNAHKNMIRDRRLMNGHYILRDLSALCNDARWR